MRPGTRPLLYVLAALLAVQFAGSKGCDIPSIVPTPKAESVLGILVEQTGDRETWLGSLIVQVQNTDLGKHKFKAWDADSIPAATKATLGPLDGFQLPTLFLIGDGKVIGARPVSKSDTVESIVASIKGASND